MTMLSASKKTTPTKSADQLSKNDARIMDVARILRCRYQKARDLILGGALGESRIDDKGKLVVYEADVLEYERRRKEKV